MAETTLTVSLTPLVIRFPPHELDLWYAGDRLGCTDPYIRGLPPGKRVMFGEFVVGRHFATLGYKWIHHDFNVLGGNREGKYPLAEMVLKAYLGEDLYRFAKSVYRGLILPTNRRMIEPDLMIYKPDYSELFFAEVKRVDTHDKLNEKQLRCIAMYSMLGLRTVLVEVVPDGREHTAKRKEWAVQPGEVRHEA